MRHLLLLFALLAAPLAGRAETLLGRVVAVDDGDRLVMQVEHQRQRIALIGIDAPEKVQPFAAQARANLGALAFQRTASAECSGRDPGGWRLCKVFVDGQDLGLRQLADGMAWWRRPNAARMSEEDRAAYERAETMAKLRRLGLWAQQNPTPPWDWRRLLK